MRKMLAASMAAIVAVAGIAWAQNHMPGEGALTSSWRTALRAAGCAATMASGVASGSYTATNLTVDACGRITTASNGSSGGGNYCDLWITGASTDIASGSCGTVSSGTWTTPSWIDSSTVATVTLLGPGGGGGGTNSNGTAGSPGGSGATCIESKANFVAASTGYSFAIGSGGAAGSSSGGAGGNGSAATTLTVGGTTYSAGAGLGGGGNSSGQGMTSTAAQPTASNCNVANNLGLMGLYNGASAYSIGANSPYGSGGSIYSGSNVAGVAATGFGAGGSGSTTQSASTAEAGGAGAAGVIHVILSGS